MLITKIIYWWGFIPLQTAGVRFSLVWWPFLTSRWQCCKQWRRTSTMMHNTPSDIATYLPHTCQKLSKQSPSVWRPHTELAGSVFGMAQTVVQRPVSVQDKLKLLTERYSQAVDRYRCIHIIRSDKHRCTDRVQTSNYRMCIRFVNFYIYIPACFQYSIITFLYFISLWCWFVGGDDLTGALHVIAPAVTTTSIVLTSSPERRHSGISLSSLSLSLSPF